jgi:nucleoside-diphosphate-sugar epimerase
MPSKSQKYVIIGGAGVVGCAVARALITQYGADVIICDHFGCIESRKWAKIPANIDDIWQPENLLVNLDMAWREIAGVIVLADSGMQSQDCDALFETAFHLPRRVWDFCARKQRPMFWASSSHVYGLGASALSSRPEDVAALAPVTAFGRAKQAFDVFAARQGHGPHTPPIWGGFRLSSVYGGAEIHKDWCATIVSKAVAAAKEGRTLVVRDDVSRDWVHVDDAALAIVQVIVQGHSGFFDIGSGQTITTRELISKVETATGKSFKSTDIVDDISERASLPAADIARLMALGISVNFRPLEQGLSGL